ncbi:hypothetical protein BSKO_13221 [Bryopsis sp. KO-2023]|nr:hypothetical protein BSKO_13221 [Bryopsis sp. KO-2023]
MMSSRIIAAILLAVFCASEARSVSERLLLASLNTSTKAVSTDKKGKASVKTTTKATDGEVNLEAEAVAESLEVVRNEIIEIKVVVEKEVADGRPVKAAAEVAARAVGKAIAKTLTTVFIIADSTGENNELCAEAGADAEARAVAAARAFVEVFTKAENANDIAEAEGVAEATATAVAEANSSASASACLSGKGEVLAYQESFANAVSTAYAKVIVDAFGEVGEDGASASVLNRANSGVEENVEVGAVAENETDGKGSSTSNATANANAGKLPKCVENDSVARCCKKGKPRGDRVCTCGLGCKMDHRPHPTEVDQYIFTLKKSLVKDDVVVLGKGFECSCEF